MVLAVFLMAASGVNVAAQELGGGFPDVDTGGGGSGGGGAGNDCPDSLRIANVAKTGPTTVLVTLEVDQAYPVLNPSFQPFWVVFSGNGEVDRATINFPECGIYEVDVQLEAVAGEFTFILYYDGEQQEPLGIGRGFRILEDGTLELYEPVFDVIGETGIFGSDYNPNCGTCGGSGYGNALCTDIPEVRRSVAVSGAGSAGSGCASCGGESGESFNELKLAFDITPLRAASPSSVGPAMSTSFDVNGHVYGVANELAVFRVTGIPRQDSVITFGDGIEGDPVDGVMYDEFRLLQRAELLDQSGNVTDDFKQATQVMVYTYEGSSYEFDLYKDEDTQGQDNANLDRDARLVAFRNDKDVETLRFDYLNDVENSRYTNGRILDRVTDRYGNELRFQYGPNVAGREAVSQVILPNNKSINFTYADDFYLKKAEMPGVWKWECKSLTTNPAAQSTTFEIEDPVRGKYTYQVSSDYIEANGKILNQPAGFFRNITNGDGENVVTVFYSPDDTMVRKVLRGNDQLSGIRVGVTESFYGDYFIDPQQTGYDAIQGIDPEGSFDFNHFVELDGETGEDSPPSDLDFIRGAPRFLERYDGMMVEQEFDDEDYLTRKTYSDQTFEAWERNDEKRLTRFRDREARVTTYEYDSIGNLIEQRVGIVDAGSGDQASPITAAYRWDYWPGTDLVKQNTVHVIVEKLISIELIMNMMATTGWSRLSKQPMLLVNLDQKQHLHTTISGSKYPGPIQRVGRRHLSMTIIIVTSKPNTMMDPMIRFFTEAPGKQE